jgi:hypothetical protein
MNFDNEPIDVFSKRAESKEQIEHIDAREIYIKGILSIIFSLISLIIGLIFMKQCFDLVRNAEKDITANPGKYLHSSIQKIKTGKIMAYIGLGIFLGWSIGLLVYMSAGS